MECPVFLISLGSFSYAVDGKKSPRSSRKKELQASYFSFGNAKTENGEIQIRRHCSILF